MTFDLPNESCAGQREEVPDKGYSTGYFTVRARLRRASSTISGETFTRFAAVLGLSESTSNSVLRSTRYSYRRKSYCVSLVEKIVTYTQQMASS
jgi:hypothetical protein